MILDMHNGIILTTSCAHIYVYTSMPLFSQVVSSICFLTDATAEANQSCKRKVYRRKKIVRLTTVAYAVADIDLRLL